MFVAAVGAIGVVGVIAIGSSDDHDDHSNHANYSEYDDAALTDEIRQKEAQLEQHRRLQARLEQEVEDEFDSEIESLVADDDIRPLMKYDVGGTGKKKLKNMSAAALEELDRELDASLKKDKQHIKEIDRAIQRINALTLSGEGGRQA